MLPSSRDCRTAPRHTGVWSVQATLVLLATACASESTQDDAAPHTGDSGQLGNNGATALADASIQQAGASSASSQESFPSPTRRDELDASATPARSRPDAMTVLDDAGVGVPDASDILDASGAQTESDASPSLSLDASSTASEPSLDEGEDAGTEPIDAGSLDPDTGIGCYQIDVHRCDCSLAEAMCTNSGGIWTEGCTSCLADAGQPSSDTTPTRPAAGCYVPQDFACDCQLSEIACSGVAGIWTDACETCGVPDTDGGLSSATTAPDAGAPPVGCYLPEEFACDCSLPEAACGSNGGIWTEGCMSCTE